MSISGQTREHQPMVMSTNGAEQYDDDGEWTRPTLMLGNLMLAAFVLFVPFIGLLIYLYQS
jgi:hypothetical protein